MGYESKHSNDNSKMNNTKKTDYVDDFVFESNVDINERYASYRPQSNGQKNNNSRRAKKSSKAKLAVIISSVVLVVIIGGVCLFAFTDAFKNNTFKFDSNVYIDDLCLDSMSYEEAKTALLEKEKSKALDISIDVKVADKTVALSSDDFSYEYNTLEVLDEAKAYCESDNKTKEIVSYEITPVLDKESVKSATAKVCTETEVKAADAKVKSFDFSAENMFTYEAEKNGIDVDDAALEESLVKLFEGGTYTGELEAEYTETKPSITQETLKKSIVLLGEYSTYSGNTSNGNSNMKTAMAACNNSIIEPGAEWSFNTCTGDSNLESNGYLPAGVIANGRSTTGIGGGICQASSTIYNAALLADMEVVERSCHRWPSDYVPIGLDATIDYPGLDLVLKNKSDTQLFLGCTMSGTKLTAKIYGVKSNAYDEIKITSSRGGSSGSVYYASAARHYYKGGELIETEELPSSTYYYETRSSSDSSSSRPQSSTPQSSTAPPESSEPETPVEPPVSSEEPVVPDLDPEPVVPDVPSDGGGEDIIASAAPEE